MPKGMRDTLYFKDDDSRLSFLQGNYVTLTNMSDHDLDRIIQYHLSPINISFQTMNPELRCKMLNNRFAGEALKKVDRLNEAGIEMNGQIVLCKGVNDGEELAFSIREMMRYIPNLQSVSVVPVGLSNTETDCFHWNRSQGRMPERYFLRSIITRMRAIRNMEIILSMPVMNGIFWQEKNCHRKKIMTAICSLKMV